MQRRRRARARRSVRENRASGYRWARRASLLAAAERQRCHALRNTSPERNSQPEASRAATCNGWSVLTRALTASEGRCLRLSAATSAGSRGGARRKERHCADRAARVVSSCDVDTAPPAAACLSTSRERLRGMRDAHFRGARERGDLCAPTSESPRRTTPEHRCRASGQHTDLADVLDREALDARGARRSCVDGKFEPGCKR